MPYNTALQETPTSVPNVQIACTESECSEHEPPPTQNANSQTVTNKVIADLLAKSNAGTRKYGTPLMTYNGRDALVDVYQECLDQAQYLKQAIMEDEDARNP